MSVVAKTATQDSIRILSSNRDYITGMETCKFTYKWKIENFSHLINSKSIIYSSTFSSHYSDFNDEWMLRIIDSNWSPRTRPSYVSVEVMKITSFIGELETTCTIMSIDKFAKKCIILMDNTRSALLNEFKVLPEMARLEIWCTITMSKKLTNNSDPISTFIATQQLSLDWNKLLLSGKSADVTIQVGQKSFRAIKGILGARSPVFSAMFDYEEFKENEKNEVVIEDIDEDVFEEFLYFIYTNESPNIDKMPMELLAVAEKYQVDRLKNICEDVVCKTINFDNVASILVFSDGYNLKKLHAKCLGFMKQNLRVVMSNKTFQVYKKKYPEIFVGVLEHLLLS